MDVNFSAEERAFREEIRTFLASDLPEDIRAKTQGGKRLVKDDYFRWHQALMKRGWLATNWPEEYGGPGWTPVQKHIFDEEC